MFNTLSHQANANQNYFESFSHAHQNGYHQENKCEEMLARMGTEELLLSVGVSTRVADTEISAEDSQKATQ